MKITSLSLLVMAVCSSGCLSSRTVLHPIDDLEVPESRFLRVRGKMEVAPKGPGSLNSRFRTVRWFGVTSDSVFFRTNRRRPTQSLPLNQVEEVRIATYDFPVGIWTAIGLAAGGIYGYQIGSEPGACSGVCVELNLLTGVIGAAVGTAGGALAGALADFLFAVASQRTHRFRHESDSARAWAIDPFIRVDEVRGAGLRVRF